MALPVQGWVVLSAAAITTVGTVVTQFVKTKAVGADIVKDVSRLKVSGKRTRRTQRRHAAQIRGLAETDSKLVDDLKAIEQTARENGHKSAAALEKLSGLDAKIGILLEDRGKSR